MVKLTTSLFLASLSLPVLLKLVSLFRESPRKRCIQPDQERVVILGASSGIGRAIAHVYAKRGARICIVGRRATELDAVKKECEALKLARDTIGNKPGELIDDAVGVVAVTADFSNPEDMVSLSTKLEEGMRGVDTLVVAAGVSALKPLLSVAGVERQGKTFTPPQATLEGVQSASNIAAKALQGNYIGPLVSAIAFIPLLTRTSKSPSILLLNSLASVIPAPTRALYASTKSASLILYQALAIEHPQIAFSFILPSTVEGDFRASAVDGGVGRETDFRKALKRENVAQRCVLAVDNGTKTDFVGGLYRLAHILYWVWPGFVERKASQKYGFNS
ncbi:NAD(P)-binding protein [Rickenella mellea]|uniref:NAD(P)-binding protein n=1 Tax=Rickenella mellea TaxID=50990 RepID=A0A4Y7QNS8_9AGAM|nr:NAD(P)-binding protein [Rickenella mellea]